jgi:peptidyl-prolyl cis-trans isomerase C
MQRLPTTTSPHRGFVRAGSSGLWLVLVGFALLAFGLAGCSANTGADPLLAARVNGSAITLAQYDSMLRFTQAGSALRGQTADLQSPADRDNLNAFGQSALAWLIYRDLAGQQLAAQHLHVTPAERKSAHDFVDSYTTQVRQQLQMQPDNAQLRALQASLTPDVIQIITDRLANEQALADQSKFPTVHVRGIYVDTQDQATSLLKQVQKGADFGTLAHDKSNDPQSASKYGDLGTIYVGQISPEFSQQVFPRLAHNQQPQKYVIAPVGTRYGLFEVTKPGKTAIPQDQQQQIGLQVTESWLSTVVQPQGSVDQYVTLS